MDTNVIFIYFLCIIALFILGKIFFLPLKKILKLLLNSILGGVLIYLINIIGTVFNFHIGLNVFTAIFIGVLGVPGGILLIIFKMII